MKITKIMTFDAAHQLPDEECYGKCSKLHGHTYKLEVTIEGDITNKGWVMNFATLKEIMNELVDKYDHSHLNDHAEFSTFSTAEVMVKYIFEYIKKRLSDYVKENPTLNLSKVRLWETSTSYAEMVQDEI